MNPNNNKIEKSNELNSDTNKNTNSNSDNDIDNEIDIDDYNENEVDPNSICHRLYQKDCLIDLENLPFIQFYKLKQKNKVFSFIGVRKYKK